MLLKKSVVSSLNQRNSSIYFTSLSCDFYYSRNNLPQTTNNAVTDSDPVLPSKVLEMREWGSYFKAMRQLTDPNSLGFKAFIQRVRIK